MSKSDFRSLREVNVQDAPRAEPVGASFRSLPDLESWGYVTEAYLGGNEFAGRSTFRVRRISDDSICLLKMVRFHESNWDTIRQIAEREYQTLLAVDHSLIPGAIELLQPEEADWIGVVQGYIEGIALSECRVSSVLESSLSAGTRRKRTQRRNLTSSEILAIGIKLLGVLVHLQERGLSHLDIKPENVIIDSSLQPHLVDFGASLHIRSEGDLKRSTMLGCTPGFIDPEVLLGGARPTDRSDLYSLGCTILCKLLNLSTDEFSNRYGVKISAASFEDLKRPVSVAVEEWNWLLSLLNFRDPAQQPASALQALERYHNRSAATLVSAEEEGGEPRGPSSGNRPPLFSLFVTFLGSALVALALSSAIGFGLGKAMESNSERESAVAVTASEDPFEFRVLKDPLNGVSKYESLDVVSIEFSGEAFELLKTESVREQDKWRGFPRSFDSFMINAHKEYEYFLSAIDGVERVSVAEAGVTIYREASSARTWSDIAMEVEARLIELGRQPLVSEQFLGADVLRCRSVCDFSASEDLEVAYAIVYRGEERSLAELQVNQYELKIALLHLLAVDDITIDAERGYISVTQEEDFQEPWPVLQSKIETVVAEFIAKSEAEGLILDQVE